MLNAIVLAGNQTLVNTDDKSNKALLMINGKPMIEYVVEALSQCRLINRIVILGHKESFGCYTGNKVNAVLDDQGTIIQNILNGMKYLGADYNILVCTSDIPMITSEAIEDFINQSEATGADLCYPIVDKKYNDVKFPGIQRTYTRLREGVFTGGNLAYINPRAIGKGLSLAERLIEARKSPLKMARILRFSFVIRLLTGCLTIPAVEKRFSELLGIRAKAIQSCYPEVGNDVDKPSDLAIATAYLSQ